MGQGHSGVKNYGIHSLVQTDGIGTAVWTSKLLVHSELRNECPRSEIEKEDRLIFEGGELPGAVLEYCINIKIGCKR